jgi:SAM-dependent methyltransferase
VDKSDKLKKLVKEKYGEIAERSGAAKSGSCCCSGSCCTSSNSTDFSDDYTKLDGYVSEADLGLGCGIPIEFAKIKAGHTVIDLGSGAGNDAFVARRLVGDNGRVIGLDMTEAMLEKANLNNTKLGYRNVEFHLGDIEKMPFADNIADVVISNCVLNLVPDKNKAFKEIFRILKPGGHFSISDIVTTGELPVNIVKAAEMYAGCVAGAIQKTEYLNIIKACGFSNIAVVKEKGITIPDQVLGQYLNEMEMASFKSNGATIVSITVYGEKPEA